MCTKIYLTMAAAALITSACTIQAHVMVCINKNNIVSSDEASLLACTYHYSYTTGDTPAFRCYIKFGLGKDIGLRLQQNAYDPDIGQSALVSVLYGTKDGYALDLTTDKQQRPVLVEFYTDIFSQATIKKLSKRNYSGTDNLTLEQLTFLFGPPVPDNGNADIATLSDVARLLGPLPNCTIKAPY